MAVTVLTWAVLYDPWDFGLAGAAVCASAGTSQRECDENS